MTDKDQAKREKMKHPDWEKYSGFPPAETASAIEDPKRKSKVKPVEPDDNGDSN